MMLDPKELGGPDLLSYCVALLKPHRYLFDYLLLCSLILYLVRSLLCMSGMMSGIGWWLVTFVSPSPTSITNVLSYWCILPSSRHTWMMGGLGWSPVALVCPPPNSIAVVLPFWCSFAFFYVYMDDGWWVVRLFDSSQAPIATMFPFWCRLAFSLCIYGWWVPWVVATDLGRPSPSLYCYSVALLMPFCFLLCMYR